MKNLTKRELAVNVAKKINLTQIQVKEVIELVLEEMTETFAQGNRIELRKFGVFEPVIRKKRVGRNPKDPKSTFIIPGHVGIKFKEGLDLKAKMLKLNPDKI